MDNLRISLVQGETRWHDPQGNRDYYGELIASLHDTTDLVLLPEMFATGFVLRAAEAAEPDGGPIAAQYPFGEDRGLQQGQAVRGHGPARLR